MASHSTVSIYNNLSSSQSAVTVWSTDYKAACRVDAKNFCILIYHALRNDCIEYIFLNIFMNLLLSHIRVMLCRKNNCIQTLWRTILIIFYSNLRFFRLVLNTFNVPSFLTSVSFLASLCASEIGYGISSGVSSEAYPNIIP